MSGLTHHEDRSGNCLVRVLVAILAIILIGFAIWATSRVFTQTLVTLFPRASATAVPTSVVQNLAPAQSTQQQAALVDPVVATPQVPQGQPEFSTAIPANITTLEQIGGGADIIIGWEDPSSEYQLIENTRDHAVLFLVSSDPGDVTVYDGDTLVQTVDSGDKGFIAALLLDPGMSARISGVGWNAANGHWNTWSEAYIWPISWNANAEEVTAERLDFWQDYEKKPLAFSINPAGFVNWLRQP